MPASRIRYTARAARMASDLLGHFEELDRVEASWNLLDALEEAELRISTDPGASRSAPGPYPLLARPDRGWVKAGRYWITHTLDDPAVIVGVFFEAADIPGRL